MIEVIKCNKYDSQSLTVGHTLTNTNDCSVTTLKRLRNRVWRRILPIATVLRQSTLFVKVDVIVEFLL